VVNHLIKLSLGHAFILAGRAALDGIIGLSALDRESAQRGELLSDANVVSI
jgi:hypothetical protein